MGPFTYDFLSALKLYPHSDEFFKIADEGDASKQVKFDVGAITTGTVRTITVPDAAVDLGTIATNATAIAALGAANTDVRIPVDIAGGLGDGGTYTVAVTSGGLTTVTRDAADAADSYWKTLDLRGRTTAGKGLTITGYTFQYSVATADATDIRLELWKETQTADGNIPTAAVVAGEADAHYDAAHDTAVKRGDDTGAPEYHTATVTLPVAEHLGAGEILKLRFYVDGDAGPASVVVLRNCILLASETLVDLA